MDYVFINTRQWRRLSGVQSNSIHEMSDLWRNQLSQWVRHANIHLKNYLQLSLKGCEWNGIISTQHCGNIRSTACTFVQRDVWEPEASLKIRTWCWKRNSKKILSDWDRRIRSGSMFLKTPRTTVYNLDVSLPHCWLWNVLSKHFLYTTTEAFFLPQLHFVFTFVLK